ncbi:MAG: beta/gamma crystallin-related protein [Ramlibacter sp.]
MNRHLKSALAVSALIVATHAAAQITFYEGEGFRGRAFTTNAQVTDFGRNGFNDRASSVVVDNGRWEACEHERFGGRCVILRRGSYDSLSSLGMANNISSVRPADNRRRYENEAPAPMPVANYEYRRRANERVYEAPVTSVRAVMGAATERCWVERQQVSQPSRGEANVGGAVVGALIGGVLGHQVGGGSGKDAATVGGAVAGGVIGSNAGRDSGGTVSRDVRRCENNASGTPAYWDVTYNYRGVNHQVQMSAAPGPTIAVNSNGLPRQ